MTDSRNFNPGPPNYARRTPPPPSYGAHFHEPPAYAPDGTQHPGYGSGGYYQGQMGYASDEYHHGRTGYTPGGYDHGSSSYYDDDYHAGYYQDSYYSDDYYPSDYPGNYPGDYADGYPSGRPGESPYGHHDPYGYHDIYGYDHVPEKKRLQSLDIARGMFLVVSVGTASVISNPLPVWLTHARWFGVTPYDLIFPVFVMLSGMGFAFAYKNGVNWAVTFRRAFVLFTIGIIYNVLVYQTYTPTTVRLTGVLQLYAILTLILGPAHLVLKNWKTWFGFTVTIAGLYTYLLSWWPQAYCNVDTLTYMCNPSGMVDTYVFGAAHLWNGGQFGHDPEGLLATLGALITASVGTTLGHFFLAESVQSKAAKQYAKEAAVEAASPASANSAADATSSTDANSATDATSSATTTSATAKSSTEETTETAKVRVPALYTPALLTAAVLALGWGLSFYVPMFKRLWTPSFGLLAAVIGMVLVTSLWLLVDKTSIPWLPVLFYPFTALGRNALLVYFGSHLLFVLLMRFNALPVEVGTALWAAHPAAAFVLLSIFAWTLLAMVLHRLTIYVRA